MRVGINVIFSLGKTPNLTMMFHKSPDLTMDQIETSKTTIITANFRRMSISRLTNPLNQASPACQTTHSISTHNINHFRIRTLSALA